MFIRSIHLENFRNYGRLDLDVGPSVNIFYGNNAQGKTNLVEGIYVASSITSHRTSKDSDLIKFGENEYKAGLDLTDDDGSDVHLVSGYYSEKSSMSRSGRKRAFPGWCRSISPCRFTRSTACSISWTRAPTARPLPRPSPAMPSCAISSSSAARPRCGR